MTGPVTAETGRSQEARARPSTRTKHAPHSPIPQPYFGPAKPRVSRSTSSNGVSGSQVTLRLAPFTLSRNSLPIMDCNPAYYESRRDERSPPRRVRWCDRPSSRHLERLGARLGLDEPGAALAEARRSGIAVLEELEVGHLSVNHL